MALLGCRRPTQTTTEDCSEAHLQLSTRRFEVRDLIWAQNLGRYQKAQDKEYFNKCENHVRAGGKRKIRKNADPIT